MKIGVQTRRVATAVGLISLLSACATTNTTPGVTIANTKFGEASAASAPAPGTTVMAQANYVFASDLYASANDSDNPSKAATAFRSGRALLDLRCNEYLDALGTANQSASNERKQIGIIGGFSSAIMGLTGSTAKAIAGTSTAFSFGGSSMDAFTTSFLFSDASKSVTKLVRDSQATYLTAAQERMVNLDYPAAVNLLTGYEEVCRPAKIRWLIDEAVASAKIVAEVPGSQVSDTAVLNLLGGLMGALKRSVTESDAINLYAWFSDTPDRSTIATNSPFVTSLLVAPETADTLEKKVSPFFLPLAIKGNPLTERWAGAVAQARAAGKAAPTPQTRLLYATPVLRVKTQ